MIKFIDDYLNNKRKIQSGKLKKLLIEHKIFDNCCHVCGVSDWLGKPLVLHLHHIDGNNKNNLLNNLQLLCPNCHSQTINFAGRNKKKSKRRIIINDEIIIDCIKTSYSRREALLKAGLIGYGGSYERINNIIDKYAVEFLPRLISEERKAYLEKKLNTINAKYGSYETSFKRKISWPTVDILTDLLKCKPISQIAKELGVSDSAVRKQAKRYKLDIKQLSPWARKHGSGRGGI